MAKHGSRAAGGKSRRHSLLRTTVAFMEWVVIATGTPDTTLWAGGFSSSGEDPYSVAATRSGVARDILVAIVGAESAYHPYALNIAGHQKFCHTRAEAEAAIDSTATDDIDIGLMQINWHFWGAKSGMQRKDLLDPAKNLLLGASILREGLARNGTLWHRISNYHSGYPRERDRYNQQVYDAYLRYKRGQVQ